MNLSVLRVLQRLPRVDVVALHQLDVPLDEVLDLGLHPFRPHDLRQRRSSWRYRRRSQRRASEREQEAPRLRLRELPDEAAEGFLIYRSQAALIDLLLRRWEPDGEDALSALVRRVRDDRRLRHAERAAELEAFLREVESRPEAWPESALLVPGDDLDLDSHEWTRLQRADSSCYAYTSCEPWVLAVEHPARIAGHTAVRRELLICCDGDELLHVDGPTLRRYTGRRQLPTSLYRRFDSRGRPLADAPGRVLPLHELWPRFLLVVPEPELLHQVDEACPAPVGPAWVVEPHRVAHWERLERSLPVLGGAEAAAVLARTTDGMCLPGTRPRAAAWTLPGHFEGRGHLPLPSSTPPPPGTLLVGCLPFPEAA